MKECKFCHNELHEEDLICPHCGSDQELYGIELHEDSYQPSLFETDSMSKEEDFISEVEETRKDKEFRMKKTESNYTSSWNQISGFFLYFKDKFVHPTEQFIHRRTSNKSYGYISSGLASFIFAFVLARLVETAISRYNLLAEISVLPIITQTPNYIFLFLKCLLLSLVFYFGFPFTAMFIKKIVLHRTQVWTYWLTDFSGMNAFSFLLLLIIFLFTVVAPFPLFVVIVFLIFLHLLSFVVTFVASFYKTVNETSFDTIYVALMGLTIQLFVMLSLLWLVF